MCYFFWLWCFLSYYKIPLISENKFLSLESSLFYFRFGVFSLVVFYAIENFSNFNKNFAKIFLIIYVLVIIDAYIQYFFGINILGLKYSGGRLSGVFGDEHVLGSYVSRFFTTVFLHFFL